MKNLGYICVSVIWERQTLNERQNSFLLTLMNFSVFEIEDFIASEWYVIVDTVVFLIFLFLVPELGVTL